MQRQQNRGSKSKQSEVHHSLFNFFKKRYPSKHMITLSKKMLTVVLCMNLALAPSLVEIANAQPINIKPQLQTRANPFATRAQQFNQSIAAIQRLTKAPLTTEQEVKSAVDTIRQNRARLKNAFDRAVDTAVNDQPFVDGVQLVAEKEGPDVLAQRLQQNPKAVFQLAGAQALSIRIKSDLQKHAQDLEAIGNKLQAASKTFEQNGHDKAAEGGRNFRPKAETPTLPGVPKSVPSSTPQKPISGPSSRAWDLDRGESDEELATASTHLLASANWLMESLAAPAYAVVVIDDAAIAGALVAAAVLLIGAWAAAKGRDFQPAPAGGKSPQAQCHDDADTKLDSCNAACPNTVARECRDDCATACQLNPFALDKAACTNQCLALTGSTCRGTRKAGCEAGCGAAWAASNTLCLALPQS